MSMVTLRVPTGDTCYKMYDLKTFLPATYRTNLNSVDWKESVVVFGCSMVYGEGLEEKDSIPFHLSNMLNCPVINMGVTGSSINFSLYNQLALYNQCSAPKGVINIWTEHNRSSYYTKNSIVNYGPWNTTMHSYGDLWTADSVHGETQAIMAQVILKNLWKDVPYYEATFFKKTQQLLGCDQLVGHMNDTDYASDGEHPGPLATYKCAEYITERSGFNFS